MKLLLPLFLLPVLVAAQGIEFEHGTWAEAQAKAKAEQKLIFMDAYTTWCGPCKMLTKQTFPDSTVGAFFNSRFVCVKMDMEKGEGIELARKYGVEVYPTLLFFQPDGVVAHRAAGFYPPAQLLDLGATALDDTRNLHAWETRYRNGDRDKAFIRQLIEARAAAYDSRAAELANEYLEQEKDLNTPENKAIVLRFANDPMSRAFQFLSSNRNAFEPQVHEDEINVFIDQVFQNYQQTQPILNSEQAQRLFANCFPEKGEQGASAFRLIYYDERSQYAQFAESAIDHFKRFPSENATELNEAAYIISKNINDKAILTQALGWVEKSVTLSESSGNRHTQAAILAKLGRKAEARKAAQRSAELAKAEGTDDTQIKALIRELGN